MLNQYYKFLDNELYKYMSDTYLEPGNRYFLILNDFDEIKKLENAVLLSEYHKNNKFYSSEFGFETVYYTVNELKVIFVFVKEGVTHDFLVTIRNKVSLQKNEWENSIVIFIIKDDLDSITGGAFDLAKQGAPFHTASLRKNLIKILDSKTTQLNKHEKIILNFVVKNRFVDDMVKYTLMDFEAVYSIIEQGEITEEDYVDIGLFKDDQISTYEQKDANKRLEENKDFFDKITAYHDRGNIKETIKNEFDGNQIVNQLSSDDWYKASYESIKKSKEKMDDLKKIDINFLSDEFLENYKDIEIWDKAGGKTKSKKQERNIIIFNGNKQLGDIELPFTKNVNISDVYVIKRGIKLYDLTNNNKINIEIKSKGKNKLLINTDTLNFDNTYYFEFTYKHNNENALSFKFRILVVNFNSEIIENIKTKYRLRYDTKLNLLEISLDDINEKLVMNELSNNEVQVDENGREYSINNFNVFNFSKLINEDENNINFRLNIQGIIYQIKLNESIIRPVPVNSLSLLKLINKKGVSMNFIENKLIQETNEFYIFNEFKQILKIEQQMLRNKFLAGKVVGDEFLGIELDTHDNINSLYNDLCELIINKNTLPSIMYFDDEIINLAEKYCEAVEEVLNSLPDNEKIQNSKTKSIHDVGMVKIQEKLYMTSLHPLNLRYEILKSKHIKNEEVTEKVLKNYNPASLLPFIVNDDSYYFSEYNENIYRWLEYKPYVKNSKLDSETTSFIIKTRLLDFKKHFNFLFEVNESFSLKVRFLHINNYKSILNGIVACLFTDFVNNENLHQINPIDLYIDNVEDKDVFYEFFNLRSLSELSDFLYLKVPSKLKKLFDEEDIIEALKSKINLYFDKQDTLFHITFMNFDQEPRFSVHNLLDISCSISEKGLLSNIGFTKMGGEFVSGFGTQGVKETIPIAEQALLWNSFVSNKQNNELNPYKKNEGIVNNVTSLANQNFDDLFTNTNWVTFIDPSVDLSYFNDDHYDLYIIHYNDQSSSFNYESITVTNNTIQYENVLKEYLAKVHKGYNDLNVENVIRSFNILNGEWLLNIVGSQSNNRTNNHLVREKLSIISAFKNVLSMLENDNIVWVPISLEEIIRVSRQQGLDASSDIFSAKELGHKGSISDDLLFMGIEDSSEGMKVHFMPVEVKIGLNKNVVPKATEQILHLYELLNRELIIDNENKFTQEYFRAFFLNLYFGNLKKFIDNNILNDNKVINMYHRRAEILNEPIIFSNELNRNYSKGLIVLFTESANYRKIIKQSDENIYEIHFNEKDAYIDADKSYQLIKEEMMANLKGIDLGTFLSNSINYSLKTRNDDTLHNETNEIEENKKIIPINVSTQEKTEDEILPNNINDNLNSQREEFTIIKEDEKNQPNNNIDNKRLLLGKVRGSNEKLYWEYGDYDLPNRHLLISGKSGQGKTYFMQCLLYELSKNSIDSLIVDYTDGFLPNQLETTFVNKLGDKLKTKFVFRDKLPINPFKRNEVDLGGISMPETNDDIADRVVQIIDFVFKLGVQQNSALKDVVKRGLSIYDQTLTFTKIKNTLLDEENPVMQNLYGRISNLLDRDPFDYNNDEYDWNRIFNFNGNVNIIQLKGFTIDIQKIITEFLLWDIYNYSQRNGNKNHPIPVLLDEMQNLNHKESSPTSKILKEGRKFGWSSWLATQSLNSIKNSGGDISSLFNAAEQIHFAAPEDQISFISKNLTTDNNSKKMWENTLSNLNKGQCIVNGYTKTNDGLKKLIELIDVIPLEER